MSAPDADRPMPGDVFKCANGHRWKVIQSRCLHDPSGQSFTASCLDFNHMREWPVSMWPEMKGE